jgi:HEAT repeat protein
MAKKKTTRAARAEIKNNEPPKPVVGGSRRRSTRVGREAFGLVARREAINELLLAHDPEQAESAMIQITAKDSPVLRQIALEGVVEAVEPVLRKRAIEHLARFPEGENLDTLLDLVRQGEDIYARTSALRALARTGLKLAIPVIRDALLSADPFEVQHAKLALADLHKAIGPGPLKRALQLERVSAARKVLAETLEEIERPRYRRRRKQRVPTVEKTTKK